MAISYAKLFERMKEKNIKKVDLRTTYGLNPKTVDSLTKNKSVTVDTLIEKGIVKNPRDGVKILGNGELTKKLNVKVDAFSASAKEKIEALGGTAEVM